VAVACRAEENIVLILKNVSSAVFKIQVSEVKSLLGNRHTGLLNGDEI
jgi:hypothetical protein